jgi:hypothetical protein
VFEGLRICDGFLIRQLLRHSEFCEKYYRDVIGSSGMGLTIDRGERNLIERIAIQLYRREEINLPSSAGR